MPRITLLFCSLLLAVQVLAQAPTTDTLQQLPPLRTQAVALGDISPLRDLPVVDIAVEKFPKTWERRNYFRSNVSRNPNPEPRNGDPLAQKSASENDFTGPEMDLLLNLEGLNDDAGIDPPDPSGDIGKDHYVQMVNSGNGARLQVWDKNGQSVLGPIETNTIWSQVSSQSIGDPIVQYDHDAERWLIMEMQGFEENQILVAISNDSDPTGAWKAYRIQCIGFPDYPKLYVWHNAYFITVNEIINNNQCSGYALNRAQMLVGADNIDTYRFSFPNYQAIQYQPGTGVDWELGPPPPDGAPGMILRVYDDAWDGGQDRIQLWQVVVDWTDIGESFSVGPTNFNVAPFETRVCHGFGLFDCLEQPDHPASPRITALENIIMYRAPYVNYGTHESIVFNHVSDISNQIGDGGDAAVRWYELRRMAGSANWAIHQQGTYAPDADNRFMGSLSLDAQGNIGLGYSVVSESVYPGIRLTGRRAGDPLGQMTVQEYLLANGTASHFTSSRWGDYSNMAVDPTDGRTFWYVGEYQPNANSWGTRIAKFTIVRDSFDVRPAEVVAPVNSSLLNPTPVTVRIANLGLQTASGVTADLYFDGVLSATDTLDSPLAPDADALLTFGPLFSWTAINEQHTIRVVTTWADDNFTKNDTLTTVVKRLPERDAAWVGPYDLPNLLCTPDVNFGLVVRNLAGLPLDSFTLVSRLNNLPIQTEMWYGHLLPGETDTIPIQLTGLTGTQSGFWAKIVLPNGLPDQNVANDSLFLRIYSNLSGQYLRLESQSDIGLLTYKIKNPSGTLFTEGTMGPGFSQRLVCAPNDKCYTIVLSSSTLNWEGQFILYDLFAQPLVSATSANATGQSFSFCTPERDTLDVGATALVQPQSDGNLSAEEAITVRVSNFGLAPALNPEVSWRTANGVWNTETYNATIAAGDSKDFTFVNTTADMSSTGATYSIEIKATIPADEAPDNDARLVQVTHFAELDASVQITKLDACFDRNNIPNIIEIKNNGLDSIVSFVLSYQLNNVIHEQSIELPEPLPKGQIFGTAVTLNNAQVGSNVLKASISQINGQTADQFPANDEASVLFNIREDGMSTSFYISTDPFPAQTTWELLDAATNNVVASGGPYELPNTYYEEAFCLEDGQCYKFRLKDAAGNGFNGFCGINNLNEFITLVSFDGGVQTFGSVWEADFCVDLTCKNFSAVFDIQPPSDENSFDGVVTVLPTGNIAPVSYGWNFITQSSPVFTGIGSGVSSFNMSANNGCTYYTVVLVDANRVVGTQDALPPTVSALTISPNPVRDLVWLSAPAQPNELEAGVEVYNSKGQLVRQVLATRFGDELRAAWGMGNQPAGVYMVVLRNGQGQVIGQGRLVK
jgi:hypothetical protein